MAYIDSIQSLLETLYKKACYMAIKATGNSVKYISNVSIDDDGIITVTFEYTLYGTFYKECISFQDSDFSDIDKGAEAAKARQPKTD